MTKIIKYSKGSLLELDISGLPFLSGTDQNSDQNSKLFTKILNRVFCEFQQLTELNLSCLTLKDLWNLGGHTLVQNSSLKILNLSKNFLDTTNLVSIFLPQKFANLKICDASQQYLENPDGDPNIGHQNSPITNFLLKFNFS
jgi:hypothetical protein